MLRKIVLLVLSLTWIACANPDRDLPAQTGSVEYAIAIHGGAGAIPRSMSAEQRRGYEQGLTRALELGVETLASGGSSLDAVEQVLRLMENDPRFNAGKGAVFNHDGENELDASIMNGADLSCGAVAGVRRIKNPISLARLVMERTDHVLLAGVGADRFGADMGVELVEPEYFHTQERYEALQRVLEQERSESEQGTVGAVALDRHGDLAAGTSTGGLTNKLAGRVGDSPIVGAGTYADNRYCAVSATGRGEEFIRRGIARSVCALVAHAGLSAREAAERLIGGELQPGDGGVIVAAPDGELAMVYNTEGMYRGAADSSGRFEVRIWE